MSANKSILARIVDISELFWIYLQGKNRNSLAWAIAFEELSFWYFSIILKICSEQPWPLSFNLF